MNRIVAAIRKFWRFLADENDGAEQIFSRVFEDNFDGLVVVGEDGRVIAASKVASTMLLGPNGGTLAGRTAAAVLPQAMRQAVQKAFTEGRRAVPTPIQPALIGDPEKGGRIAQFVVTLSELPVRAGPLPRRVVNLTFWDETERRLREQELAYLGRHDPVTGALVRAAFVKRIAAALKGDRQRSAGLSVLVISISSIDMVEATLGLAATDLMLRQVFSRLKAAGFETIARIEGQGFAVIWPGRQAEERAARFYEGLIDRMTLPYAVGERSPTIGVAIGIARTDHSGDDAEALLTHAVAASNLARQRQPENAWVLFDAEMVRRLRERQNLGPALQLARSLGQMSIVYQPQCLLETGGLVGVEATLRWVHPEFGVVPPAQFLPLAEENGEIVDLGRWMLREACREVAGWPFETRLFINLAPAFLARADVVAEIQAALTAAGMPAGRLGVEVSEGPLLESSMALAGILRQLRGIGVAVTLDEFGAGQSSLGQVARLTIDEIKVAGRFVAGLPADSGAGAVVRAVMTLSDTLGKAVVADGVENADQAWMLRMMGCRVGQGPYFGRPRPGTEFVEWYGSRQATRAAG